MKVTFHQQVPSFRVNMRRSLTKAFCVTAGAEHLGSPVPPSMIRASHAPPGVSRRPVAPEPSSLVAGGNGVTNCPDPDPTPEKGSEAAAAVGGGEKLFVHV